MIRLSIRRPVAVSMAYLAVALLGVAAWRNIPIELLPDTRLPRLQVVAFWPGASPEQMEAFVTSPLESAVQQVRGVEKVTSISREEQGQGRAELDVEFSRSVDMNFARLELSERLGALEERLPPTVRYQVTPYVPREFEDQNQPTLRYTVSGPYVLEALRAHLDDVVVPELLLVDGVGHVAAHGGRNRVIEIELDEAKILGLGLGIERVRQKIRELEYVQQAGAVEAGGILRMVAIRERPESPADLLGVPLLADGGRIVRVSDVARVYDTFEDATSYYRIDGQPAVYFEVFRQIGTNTVAVADAVRARLAELEPLHPPGVRLHLDRDESEAVRAQLTDLRYRALIAAAVIFMVLLLFLQSFRSAAIVFATIGFSILIALNLIYFGGLTLNVLTLMGLAMGFGLIVDNAIVVLENIYRRRRRGEPADEAAEHGAREVVLPILAAMLTTVVVFIPFVYLQGDLRVYYIPLAVVVGFSLVASLFVAFSFIPGLAAKLLRSGTPRLARLTASAPVGPVTPPDEGGEPDPSGEGAPRRESLVFIALLVAVALSHLFREHTIAVVAAGAFAAALGGTAALLLRLGVLTSGSRFGSSAAGALLAGLGCAVWVLAGLVPYDAARTLLPLAGVALFGAGLALEVRAIRRGSATAAATAASFGARPPFYIRAYSTVVGSTLRLPWITVVLALVILGASYRYFDDNVTRGTVWGSWWAERTYIDIHIRFPRGEELERTDELTHYFEARLARMPEVDRFMTRVFATSAHIRVTFPDSLEHTPIPVFIKDQLYAYSHQFGGAEVRVYGFGPSFYGGGASPPNYTLTIKGYSYEAVRDIAEDLADRLTRFARIQEVDPNAAGRWQRDRSSEIVLALDRRRLGLYDLTARDVVDHVAAAVRGETRGDRLRFGGEEVGFAVKLDGHRDMDDLELAELLVPTPAGDAVRLGDIAALDERRVMGRIHRENQQYVRYVAYEFRGPHRLGDRIRDVVVEATHLPHGYEIETRQEWRWSDEERRQIYTVLAIALVLIFMATAALFESLRQPFCVLLAVPMALVGVFLIFYFTGANFTREAYIGVIMMGGIVVNNAILLVDHVNQLRRKLGLALRDAVLRGTLERVRPILMTSVTTIFGLLPLVLFSETVNANIWNALGFALIGGLASSTVFVLTVTPALYYLFERRPERRRLGRAAA